AVGSYHAPKCARSQRQLVRRHCSRTVRTASATCGSLRQPNSELRHPPWSKGAHATDSSDPATELLQIQLFREYCAPARDKLACCRLRRADIKHGPWRWGVRGETRSKDWSWHLF